MHASYKMTCKELLNCALYTVAKVEFFIRTTVSNLILLLVSAFKANARKR